MMNTIQGMIRDLNRSKLVANDGVTDIATTSGELIIALDNLAHYEELEESGQMVELPCAVGDTVYHLCKCDDGKYRIFPMIVVDINVYGALRRVNDKEPSVYNIYAESDYTYLFSSFYDIGKTVFFTHEEAESALQEDKDEYQ